jgi:hypothetical protein
VHSAIVRINEELLERNVAAPVQKTEINDRRGSAAPTTQHPSIRKSWHQILPNKWRSLSRYSRLKAIEFVLFVSYQTKFQSDFGTSLSIEKLS